MLAFLRWRPTSAESLETISERRILGGGPEPLLALAGGAQAVLRNRLGVFGLWMEDNISENSGPQLISFLVPRYYRSAILFSSNPTHDSSYRAPNLQSRPDSLAASPSRAHQTPAAARVKLQTLSARPIRFDTAVCNSLTRALCYFSPLPVLHAMSRGLFDG